jgi:4'-phosphopantetheinyl transferase
MPLEIFETGEKRAWALWRIEESETKLAELLTYKEDIPPSITNQQKRLEWLTGRLLTQTLLENFELIYAGIIKDEHGKPFVRDTGFHLSLTHSYPFAGAIIDRRNPVGIDLEQPKDKLLRIAHRVLSASELNDAGSDVVKHCIYWCAKESLIKIHGKKDLTLAQNLQIDPFDRNPQGNIIGRIIVNEYETVIPLYYKIFNQFVVVFNREE